MTGEMAYPDRAQAIPRVDSHGKHTHVRITRQRRADASCRSWRTNAMSIQMSDPPALLPADTAPPSTKDTCMTSGERRAMARS